MNKKIEEMNFEELLEEINKNNPKTVNQAKKIMYEKYLKRLDEEHKNHNRNLSVLAIIAIIVTYILFLFIMQTII